MAWRMPAAVITRSAGPFLLRTLRGVLLALLVVSPIVLALLAVETTPRVTDPGPPDAAAAGRTRDVAESIQELIATEAAAGRWSAREEEMNAVLAAAQRLRRGLFGVARVTDDALVLDVSAGAPIMPKGLWANLHLAIAPSEEGLRIAAARIGRLPVPPGLALRGLRLAADRVLGDGLGTQAIDSIAAVRLQPPQVTVAFDFDAVGREAFFERLRERALAGAGKTAREQVYVQLWHLDKAVSEDRLPREGSMLPYLKRVVRTAAQQSKGEDREELRAALYALALYCGDPAFGDQIGVTLAEKLQGGANGCDGTTLAGHDDLKRHFAISAGLFGATASDSAFGMGELKELLDSNAGGSGFSFTDMVADVAGVRFARAFLDAPRGDWPAMLRRIRSEADVIPSLEGLPGGLTEAEFRARYRDVDSEDYAAMVAEIERRVDALPLYAAPKAD